MAIANIDLLEILKAYMVYDTWRRQKEEQKFAPSAQVVEKRGWEEGKKQLGEKSMLDLWSYLYGKKAIPPQKTTWETTGELGPSYEFPGMEAQGIQPPGYTTQPRTTIQWPPQTTAQMLERGAAQYLQQPGVTEQAAKGKLGFGTPWERVQAEVSKRGTAATLAQPWIKEGVPGATDYWTAFLSGKTPVTKLPALTKTENQWEHKDTLASVLSNKGLYGQNINSINPIDNMLVRKAETAGAAILDKDGTILSAGQARKPEAKAPKGDWFETKPGIEEYHEWTPEKGWLPTGKTRSRWKPEEGITPAGRLSSLQRAYDDEVAETRIKYSVSADPITKMIFFRNEEQKEPYFREVKKLQKRYNIWSKKITGYPMFPEIEEEKEVESKPATPLLSIVSRIKKAKTKEEALNYIKRQDVKNYMKQYDIREEDILPYIWKKFLEKPKPKNMP